MSRTGPLSREWRFHLQGPGPDAASWTFGSFGSFGDMTLHVTLWSSQAGADFSTFGALLGTEPLNERGLLILDVFFCNRDD